MNKKLSVTLRYLSAFFVLSATLLFAVFSLALFIKTLPFKVLTSPAPQIIIIGIATLLISGATYILLARRANSLKQSKIKYIGIFGAVLAIFSLVFTLTIQSPQQIRLKEPKDQITFTTYNRLFETNDTETPINYIRQQGSDVISLQEVSKPTYAEDFAKELGFDYFEQAPNNDVAIVSRWPIIKSEVLQNGSKQVLRAEIATPYGVISTYAIHVTPPFSNSMYKEGLQELETLAKWVAEDELSVVAAGDYNTAIYSPEMRAHTKAIYGNVKHTTEQAWPKCSYFGQDKIACIRIDYVFIPQTAAFYSSDISPDLGSDHRAVTVRFGL